MKDSKKPSSQKADSNGKDTAVARGQQQSFDVVHIEAWRLWEQRKYQEALAEFEKALQLEPDDERALYGKMSSLRLLGRTDEARKVNAAALKKLPNSVYFLNEQGWHYYDARDYENARTSFKKALETDPNNLDALQWHITCLRFLGRYDEAEAAIDDAMTRHPKSTRFVTELGWLRYNLGNYQEALKTFERVLQFEPYNEHALLWRIKCLRLLNRYNEAEALIEPTLTLLPQNERLLNERGWLYFDLKKYAEAAEAFQETLDVNPANEEALLWRAKSLRFAKNFSEAEAAIKNALDRVENNDAFFVEQGWLFYDQKKYDEAIAAFDRALALNPGNLHALQWKATCLRFQEKFKEAEQLLDAALERFPENTNLLNEQGWLFYDQKKYREAIEAFDRTLTLDPNNEDALVWKSTSLRRLGEFQEAVKLLSECLERFPDSVKFLNERGWLYFDKKEYKEAVSAFNQTLKIDPQNESAHLWRIKANRFLMNYEEALKQSEEALQYFPENVRFLNERGWIYYELKKYPESADAFDQTLKIDKENEDALVWKSSALRMQRDYDGAQKLITKVLKRFPKNVVLLNELGLLHYDKKEFKKAQEAFDKALAIQPSNDFSRLWRDFSTVEILVEDNHHFEALKLYEQLQRDFPNELQVWDQLGWFYIRRNDLVNAKMQFEYIVDKDPDNVSGINGLAGVYFNQGKYEEAEENFRKALEVEPSEPVFYTNVAWALARQDGEKEWQEAESLCREALRLDPNRAEAYGCLGVLAYRRGHYRDSEAFFLQSIEVSPKNGSYTDLGALYVQMGRYEDAEQQLKKAIEYNPDDFQAHIELGNIYLQGEAHGTKKEAIREFRQAVALAPENEEPIRALAIGLMQSGDLNEAEKVLQDAIRRIDRDRRWRLHLVYSQLLMQQGSKSGDREFYEEALAQIEKAKSLGADQNELHFQEGIIRTRLDDYQRALKSFRICTERDKSDYLAERNARKVEGLIRSVREERIRTKGPQWGGVAIGIISFLHLAFLWILRFKTDKVTDTMLTVMVPLSLGLVVVAFLLPFLSKLKLPGGFEAELSQPQQVISKGPSGDMFGSSTPKISTGPN